MRHDPAMDADAEVVVAVEPGDGSPLDEIRALAVAAFEGDYDDDDWAHALGGRHVFATFDGMVVAHAAVIPRVLTLGEEEMRVGYVETVAVSPSEQGRGLGALVMRHAGELILSEFDLGGLATGVQPFYESLGWVRWRGRTHVHSPDGRRRTEKDDGGVMVLLPQGSRVDLYADIVCDWRDGEVW